MILRFAYGFALVLMLSNCGDNVSPFVNVARSLLAENESDPMYGKRLAGVTPELLESFRFSLIFAELDRTKTSSFMRPMERNGNVETWIGTHGNSLSMTDGIIVATRGYGYDLASSKRPSLGALRRYAKTGEVYEITYRHWDSEGNLQTRVGTCKASGWGDEVEEACKMDLIEFTNSYKLDPNGITSSLQWISPERGNLRTVRLK